MQAWELQRSIYSPPINRPSSPQRCEILQWRLTLPPPPLLIMLMLGGVCGGAAANAALSFHTEVKAAVSGQLPGSFFRGGLRSPSRPPADRVLQGSDY